MNKRLLFIGIMVLLGFGMGLAQNYYVLLDILEPYVEITTTIPNRTSDNFSDNRTPYLTTIKQNTGEYSKIPEDHSLPFYFKLVDKNGSSYVFGGEYNDVQYVYDDFQNHSNGKIIFKYEILRWSEGNETHQIKSIYEYQLI